MLPEVLPAASAVPAVPFALLGTVTLLAVAGWAVLGAAGLALRGLRLPAVLLVLGAGTLVAVEVRLAISFVEPESDPLALARAAGALLLAAGLALGALDGQQDAAPPVGDGPSRAGPEREEPAPALGVVVPLGAPLLPASAGLVALLAAAAVLLSRRAGTAGTLLAAGLGAHAAAAGFAAAADTSATAAVLLLGLRGAGAALLLAGALSLGQRSLLAKVVAALLAGVLVMASAAIAVVGTAVVDSYERQADELVTDTAQARAAALQDEPERLRPLARVLARVANGGSEGVTEALTALEADPGSFLVQVDGLAGGAPSAESLGAAAGERAVTQSELNGLATSDLVSTAAREREIVPGLLVLTTSGTGAGTSSSTEPSVRLVSAVAVPVPPGSALLPVEAVRVFASPVDALDLETGGEQSEGYRLVLAAGSPLRPVASTVERPEAERLTAVAGDGSEARTVAAQGEAPTVRVQPVGTQGGTAYLVVARSAEIALQGQRDALTGLLLAALGATAVVGLLTVVLGRRTVEPVRRLTAAASRVAAGDLDAPPPAVSSGDEVGTLARTFATMTGALSTLTGDLRSTAARLETVLASMSDGLLATDGDGRITSANRAALEMLGQDAVVGERLREVADVRDAEGAPLADPALRLADAPGEVHRPDGTTLPVRVALTDLLEGEGVVLVLRDTTREREVERMKTEFLSNVSHELRTPLTPIRGYADILTTRSDRLQPAQVATFAGTILSETLKMNRVVDLLVDVAALEAGRVSLRPRDVDVRELVEGRLAAWRVRVPGRADDLRKRVGAGLPLVHVDPEWVAKALDELLDNALKHTPPGTSVTLAATRAPEGDRVRVAVRDTGPGIPEADQALLFTSFEQVDGSATRRVGGLGLGLSFVRRLADDTGLPLTVRSTLGKGSEFALDLPPGAPRPAAPRRRAAPVAR